MEMSAGLLQPLAFGESQVILRKTSVLPSERRRRPRRAADQEQPILASLSLWFANLRDQPLLIIDSHLTVILINDAARHALPMIDGLEFSNRKLAFIQNKHALEVRKVLDQDNGRTTLKCRFSRKSMDVVVSPIVLDGSKKLALIVLSLPCGYSLRTEFICAEYGLTRTESEISFAIFNGLSLVQIAYTRGVSANTIKTHVRHIFRKCKVNSKVSLTRQLGELFFRAERS